MQNKVPSPFTAAAVAHRRCMHHTQTFRVELEEIYGSILGIVTCSGPALLSHNKLSRY